MDDAEAINDLIAAAAAADVSADVEPVTSGEEALCRSAFGDALAADTLSTGYPASCAVPCPAEELSFYGMADLISRQAGYRTDARTGAAVDDWEAGRWVIAHWAGDPVTVDDSGAISHARHGQGS